MAIIPQSNNTNSGFNINKEYQKANAAINMGSWDLVITLMRGVLQVEPEAAPAFLKIAYAYLQRKEYEWGIQTAYEGVRLDADNDYAHALYGELLYKGKRYVEAEREFNVAISINPLRALNHYWYADYLLLFKKDVKRAETHIAKALEIAPENADYHVLMGMVRTRQNRPELAAQEYKIALSIDPEHHYAINNYGVYLMNVKRRPKEAVELFRQALIRDPNEPLFLTNLKRAESASRSVLIFVRQFNGLVRRKVAQYKNQILKWGGIGLGIFLVVCISLSFLIFPETNPAANFKDGLKIFFDVVLAALLFIPYIIYTFGVSMLLMAGIINSVFNLGEVAAKKVKKLSRR